MKKTPAPRARPMTDWTVDSVTEHSVCFAFLGGVAELRSLAAGLWRLRAARGFSLPAEHSWAVVKRDWPAPAAAVETVRGRVSFRTSEAMWSLDLKSGEWKIEDKFGLPLFSNEPGETAFTDKHPQLTLKLEEGETLFGLGETTGPLNKRGLVRELWNTDVLGHASCVFPGLRRLYVSIPFLVSLRNGRAAGLFWDNTSRMEWDLGRSHPDQCRIRAESGEIDLYFFLGPKLGDIGARHAELTGAMPMPPRWALGYQQSRYSYETRARVEQLAESFRSREIPCDAIHLDIHHMDEYRVFTFGKSFPNPKEMIEGLAAQGFKTVAIVDPGVKNDPKFPVLKRGMKENAFVKGAKGARDYLGKVWPGVSRFPDFFQARTRTWWGREQGFLHDMGVAGIWNDMNEPANFALPTKTLPEDCRHATEFGPRRHAEVHNAYGSEMARASREGALAHAPNRRPFVISRAGYAGIQRHALVWTGDNSSYWEHLAESIPMLLNLGLSGVAFCGADTGGFLDDANDELLARWTQLAAFTPFFRNHSNIGTRDQEPWCFGPEVEEVCRQAIQLRYQLLPYLYCLFAEARLKGTPIMRPLLWHHQNDPVAAETGDQFLLGQNLLVAPILRPGAKARSVYLPAGPWHNFWTGEPHSGRRHVLALAELDTIPLFVRGGTILPLGPAQQYVDEVPTDIVNLHVWPGAPGELQWYEDDGQTNEYESESGAWLRRNIRYEEREKTSSLEFSATEGSFASRVKTWRIVFRNVQPLASLKVRGKKALGQYAEDLGIHVIEVANGPVPIRIEWTSPKYEEGLPEAEG